MYLSDLEESATDGLCRECGEASFYWIEIEHEDGYRERGLWCRTHGDQLCEELAANARHEHALDEAAKARLGFDPEAFCEHCGYRFGNRGRYALDCRCLGDALHPFEVEPFESLLYRDERREILAGRDAV